MSKEKEHGNAKGNKNINADGDILSECNIAIPKGKTSFSSQDSPAQQNKEEK